MAKIKDEAQTEADKLAQVEALVIPMKVSPTGVIYGSVNSVQIAEKLAEKGFEIDRKYIQVGDVKAVGDFKATIKLHKEVSVEIPFTVVADEN